MRLESHLGPEVDGKADGVHRIGVPPDEEAPENDATQPVPRDPNNVFIGSETILASS